jgi:predicted peptidase
MKRRELLPLAAGVAGSLAAAGAFGASSTLHAPSGAQLRRVTYQSARTGEPRDYFVYLPPGHAHHRNWPVMLFLHGDGERGDARAELDYVLIHGPLYEAWCQKRDLPFVIVSPQLPKFGMADVDYIKNRTPAQIPRRLAHGINPRPDPAAVRLNEPMQGKLADPNPPNGIAGEADGWSELESELLGIVDATVANFRGDAKRVSLTGLSSGAFGAWYLAARHPEKFAALAPVAGYGHPDLAAPLADAKLPLWAFAGGRDPVVPVRFFYPLLNRLEALGHSSVRFTVHEDLGHFTWMRVYEGQDLFSWMLAQAR